jgi:hypothetical protein
MVFVVIGYADKINGFLIIVVSDSGQNDYA